MPVDQLCDVGPAVPDQPRDVLHRHTCVGQQRHERVSQLAGSSDGLVISGWGAIARTEELAAKVVQGHIDQDAEEPAQ